MSAFYVSVIDGPRVGLLFGPVDSKAEAESRVSDAKRAAETVDPFAHFYAFGVSRWKGSPEDAPVGTLNTLLTADSEATRC